jgi:hypothetical protein
MWGRRDQKGCTSMARAFELAMAIVIIGKAVSQHLGLGYGEQIPSEESNLLSHRVVRSDPRSPFAGRL